MCLKVESEFVKPKKAEKDIECYKVMRYDELKSGKVFVSPYTGKQIDKKCFTRNVADVARCISKGILRNYTIRKITKRKFKNEIVRKHTNPRVEGYYIGEGAIHSFASIKDGKHELGEWRRLWKNYTYTLIKCIIPKGTLYYEGDGCGDLIGTKQYASRSIIYKEILDD